MQENRAMDDESKAILREIVACLKERNEHVRGVRAESAARYEKDMERIHANPHLEESKRNLEESRLERGAMTEESRTHMAELAQREEHDRQERREFQSAILAEMRRLNENIETMITQGGTSGVLI
jgi:hypothetical protein